MNTERAILKGHLAELKQKKIELATAISGKIRAAKSLLVASNILPIARIDLAGAALELTEASAMKTEYAGVCETIAELEAELE